MELCLRPGGWLSALARLFAAEDPAPQSRAQARPEVNAARKSCWTPTAICCCATRIRTCTTWPTPRRSCQDTLVQFLKTAPVFLNKAHEKAWLLRVAANLSKNRLSYNKLRQTDELNEELTAEGREDLSFVWDAVRQLPVQYREAVHLFYYEGLSTRQIASVLDRSEATIRSDLHRGREQLKRILKEAYGFEV